MKLAVRRRLGMEVSDGEGVMVMSCARVRDCWYFWVW